MTVLPELIKELELAAAKPSLTRQLEVARKASAEARRAVREVTDAFKTIEEIAELRLQNAAYAYMLQYNTTDECREAFVQRYEEALAAARLGINPYWMILRNQDFASEISRLNKLTAKTRRNRSCGWK